jgi:hypothetical protein
MSNIMLSARATQERINRAMRICESNLVRQISPSTFVVASESNTTAYYIVDSRGCNCPDSIERKMLCKHVWACYIGAALTIWRMQLAESASEVETLAAYYLPTTYTPAGIVRTIQLERQQAIERLME